MQQNTSSYWRFLLFIFRIYLGSQIKWKKQIKIKKQNNKTNKNKTKQTKNKQKQKQKLKQKQQKTKQKNKTKQNKQTKTKAKTKQKTNKQTNNKNCILRKLLAIPRSSESIIGYIYLFISQDHLIYKFKYINSFGRSWATPLCIINSTHIDINVANIHG